MSVRYIPWLIQSFQKLDFLSHQSVIGIVKNDCMDHVKLLLGQQLAAFVALDYHCDRQTPVDKERHLQDANHHTSLYKYAIGWVMTYHQPQKLRKSIIGIPSWRCYWCSMSVIIMI